MQVEILNRNGEKTGRSIELKDAIFGIEPKEHAVYLDVKQYLANQRQGTHKAKERAEISGSTKKLKRQKGTGTARAGSVKSPVMVGGGRVFGPRPRDYGFKLNKKVKQLARKSVLSDKAANSQILIVEDFVMDKPRTKDYMQFLNNIGLEGQKSLLLMTEEIKNVYLSSRNLPKTKAVVYNSLNTYDLLHTDKIIIFEQAVSKIEAMFA